MKMPLSLSLWTMLKTRKMDTYLPVFFDNVLESISL